MSNFTFPAALVAVGRGGGAEEGFALAAVVEALPYAYGSAWFSFGVGLAMPKEGNTNLFGGVDGTCGLWQNAAATFESDRRAATMSFGRRADRDDHELGPPIVQGSRLALRLSPRGAEGTRTARFFVDMKEVAVFADIEDDGGDSDWVAGVTLSDRASVRLVAAEGEELIPLSHEEAAEISEMLAAQDARQAVKRCFEEVVGKAWPGDMSMWDVDDNLARWSGLLLRGDDGTDGGREPYTEARLAAAIRSDLGLPSEPEPEPEPEPEVTPTPPTAFPSPQPSAPLFCRVCVCWAFPLSPLWCV
eukprot:COSAG04_NODE_522_length_13154_cov_27.623592_5_plen_303_part_00